jgi:histidinol-phosphate aminotransferase
MLVLGSPEQADQLTHELLTRGIIVRPLRSFGLPHCVRISTGTDEDNQRAVEAMSSTSIRSCVGFG